MKGRRREGETRPCNHRIECVLRRGGGGTRHVNGMCGCCSFLEYVESRSIDAGRSSDFTPRFYPGPEIVTRHDETRVRERERDRVCDFV